MGPVEEHLVERSTAAHALRGYARTCLRNMTRILIADDHQMVREGFKRILTDHLPRAVFGESGTVQETLTLLRREVWDVLVLDLFMPGGGGFEVLHQAVAQYPILPILVISSAPPEQLALRTLRAGAAGYLSKQAAAEELVQAIRKVLAGNRYLSSDMADQLVKECTRPALSSHKKLTDREFQVLQMIVAGKSLKESAAELGVSPKTVSTFHTRILAKLRLHNTAELIRYAIEHHLVESTLATQSIPN